MLPLTFILSSFSFQATTAALCILLNDNVEQDRTMSSAQSWDTGDTAILISTVSVLPANSSCTVSSVLCCTLNTLSNEILKYNLYSPLAQAVGDSTHPTMLFGDCMSKKHFTFRLSIADAKLMESNLPAEDGKMYLSTAIFTVAVSSVCTPLLSVAE